MIQNLIIFLYIKISELENFLMYKKNLSQRKKRDQKKRKKRIKKKNSPFFCNKKLRTASFFFNSRSYWREGRVRMV